MSKWKGDISPRVTKKLEETKNSFRWGSFEYEISKGDDKNDKHMVNLAQRTCICRE